VSISLQADVSTCASKQLVEVFGRVICFPTFVSVCLKPALFLRLMLAKLSASALYVSKLVWIKRRHEYVVKPVSDKGFQDLGQYW